MPRLPANQKAFTLIEVLMAATVLVVSFTAVIQAVTTGADMIDTARKQQIAQQIIDEEIAHQRTLTWDYVPDGILYGVRDMADVASYRIWVNSDGTIGNDPGSRVPDHFALPNNANLIAVAKGFSCQAVGTYLRSPPTGFVSVTYTVTWTGYLGRTHTRTGVAYLAQNGLHLSYQR